MAFPQVGLQVILDIKQFQSQQKKLQSLMADLNKAFQKAGTVGKQFLPPEDALRIAVARENVKTYEKALSDVAKTYAQLEKAGAPTDILKQIGDEFAVQQKNLIGATRELEIAQQAGQQASSGMASGMASAAATATILAVAIGAVVKISKECADAFMEQENNLRMLQAVMGTTALETAGYIKQLQDLGLSQATIERAFGAFTRQIEAVNLAEAEGVVFTNAFTRAMDRLFGEVEWKHLPPEEAFSRIGEMLQRIPSFAERSALALQVSGRFNKEAIIYFQQMLETQEEAQAAALKYGTVSSNTSKAIAEDWRKASSDLNSALTGLKSMFGELVTVIGTQVVPKLAEAISKIREFTAGAIAQISALEIYYDVLIKTGSISKANAAAQLVYAGVYDELTKKVVIAENAQDELTKKEANAAYVAELAADKRKAMMKKEQDALKELQDARDKALQSYQRGLEDLARSEERAAIERGLRAGWEVEDTLRRTLQRQSDLRLNYQRKLEDIERDAQQKIQDQRKEQQRKLEDLERQHQIRLLQIQFAYTDAVEEALRSNDTVAILRAMRERKRALRDEELKQTEQRDQLQRDYEERRQDQAAELQRQRDEAKRNYEQALADLQVAIQLESEEKARQGERDRIMRELQHKWALEDLRRQYDQQLKDAQAAYEKQRAEYAQFLTDMGTAAATGIITISNQIAAAIDTGSQTVLHAEEQWLKRHFYLMSEAVHSSIGLGQEQQWLRRHQYFAEGGIDVAASGAKTATYGEAGPEMAMFIPLQHTMNINHRFGNLGLSLNGQSLGGGSQQQMEAIAWAVLGQLPDILKGKR